MKILPDKNVLKFNDLTKKDVTFLSSIDFFVVFFNSLTHMEAFGHLRNPFGIPEKNLFFREWELQLLWNTSFLISQLSISQVSICDSNYLDHFFKYVIWLFEDIILIRFLRRIDWTWNKMLIYATISLRYLGQ